MTGFEVGDDHAEVTFDLRGRTLELRFNFTARHQAENAAAALLAYEALGLPLDRAQEGADRIAFSRWRGEETALPGEGLLINDAYNANPVSMEAALEHLTARANGRRRVAVLGDMAELGEGAPAFHEQVGRAAARQRRRARRGRRARPRLPRRRSSRGASRRLGGRRAGGPRRARARRETSCS